MEMTRKRGNYSHFRKKIGAFQDDRGIRHADHLYSHKDITNSSASGTTSTEHFLKDGRSLQTSKKARIR